MTSVKNKSSSKSVSSNSISTAITFTSNSTTSSTNRLQHYPSHRRVGSAGRHISPTRSVDTSGSNNSYNMGRSNKDRSGAFPQMPNNSSNIGSMNTPSPSRILQNTPPKYSHSPTRDPTHRATSSASPSFVHLPPKLPNHGNVHNGTFSSASSATVPTNNNNSRVKSVNAQNLQSSSNNTVASNGSYSSGSNRTPVRHRNQYNRTSYADEELEQRQPKFYAEDDHSQFTQGSNFSKPGFVSTPQSFNGAASVAGSVNSVGSGRKSTMSGGSGLKDVDSFIDSVKQKGIAKRKRKEFARDPRYQGTRKLVDDLNKAIGVDKRQAAIANANVEFDHNDEMQHNAELYLGAANVLCLVLSMSDQEDEIESICSALEMVYRAEREAIIISYQDVGPALVPLLLRLLDRCELGRKVLAEVTIEHISRILLHMTRISELRVPLANHPGFLSILERVSTLPLSEENRVLRMRLLANLANSDGNKETIFERSSLLESIMKVATLDKSESAREYAAAVLMDLASHPANQIEMAKIDKVLGTFVKLAIVEDKVETREYAVSGLQNLAFEKQNRKQLVTYGSGVVIEALKKTTSIDANDKTRRRSAGALTNLACDETADLMGKHAGLLKTLAHVSISDKNEDVQQRATLALTKLSNSITVKMSSWSNLLDALITASQCKVADGIVTAMFRVKTRAEENRTSMANHPRLLETLSRIVLDTEDQASPVAYKDCENVTKAIAHLANDPLNHKVICNKHILAALVHGASLSSPAGAVTRDAAILAMERMAMDHSNRPMMARYSGMLVSIAKATEREMNEELNGVPKSSASGQPRLAKPLLMSLLVAM
eukprot:scaffold2205_cov141-Skeletonema_menzelii.AAC.3